MPEPPTPTPTTAAGWIAEGSPFHAGETAVQIRLGVQAQAERQGRRMIRDHLPEQHRDFYASLPFVLIGSTDDRGRPWASILVGAPGFMHSPDPRRLWVDARPLPGDPLRRNLHLAKRVGVLGLQPETRRRNRLAGRVAAITAEGFAIDIDQAFGNCPQYIQTRDVRFAGTPASGQSPRVDAFTAADAQVRALIEQADAFFIATAAIGGDADPTVGADVSHRGGRPGFVRCDDAQTIVFPDFSGNRHFNTIGNLMVDPRAGLLFVDFARGDLVWLTGQASVVWEGEEVRAFAGAERLIRVRIDEGLRATGALPLDVTFGAYSPSLESTGTWAEALQTLAASRERDRFIRYVVEEVHKECETITSFLLRRADGQALVPYEAGQFLPVRLTLPGSGEPVVRTYTLSDAPSRDGAYRLSIRREPGGLVSRFFHDAVGPGFVLEAMVPRGRFVLDHTSNRPVALISAGVGITPMLAMADWLIDEGRRTHAFRPIWFIHGSTSGRTLAFGPHLRALARAHPSFRLHVRFSRPDTTDRVGQSHDSEGRVDVALLRRLLPLDAVDVYLCGPSAFMQTQYDGLIALGVPDARIHAETFGPAALLRRVPGAHPMSRETGGTEAVDVRFARSAVEARWTPGAGTLLDLAEQAGLAPAYGCRTGICGTCAAKLSCGAVAYVQEPVAVRGEGEVLICCAEPRPGTREPQCGAGPAVVIQL